MASSAFVVRRFLKLLLLLSLGLALTNCGGGSNGGGGGGGGNPPPTPTGLTANAGNTQVALTWNASSGATSYHVKRSLTSGSGYTQIAAPSGTNYTDTQVTNGTPYYYVVSAVNANGESANSGEAKATPIAAPPAPTGLTATPGNAQVALTWNASNGATSYHLKRSTTNGSGYTQIAAPNTNAYTDSQVTNGTTYYYVVTAANGGGESNNSNQAAATPTGTATAVNVTIDVLTNRHPISPYIYGGAYPKDAATITDSGLSVVRWGGNATSQYNWMTQTSNSANDWWFSDYTYTEIGTSDSVKFVQNAKAAGTNPLMTMVMLDWVSRGDPANNTNNGQLYSFSKAKYGAQCSYRTDNADAGNGQQTDCKTNITVNDKNDADVPIFDDNTMACPPSAKAPCVYRKDWATALATAFGNAPHFYDMDNEIDIWGGTHHNVHPNPSGYEELRDTYLRVARGLKTWDPAAIRLGPVSCCWWFYWNGANGNDKGAHAGVDFLPWWLNEVYWQDQIAGTQSIDAFDIHAYPDADTGGLDQAHLRALAVSIYRDYWDPTFVSPGGVINQPWATQIQPNKTIPFRIPRMRAMVNMIYPGVPLAITEWSAEFAGASDFSTALGDADAYGILGRENVYLASRWTAPDPANPNYQALKLYTNYDGSHHMFGTTSVSATHNADPNLFSVYAAVGPAGTPVTIMVINKDPANAAQVTFAFNSKFTPATATSYTLSQANPTAIVPSPSQPWSATQTFAPYSSTLLVVTGAPASSATAEWTLNPDAIQVAAGGTTSLFPAITQYKTPSNFVTLQTAQFDSCSGSLNLVKAQITPTPLTGNGQIDVTAGNTSGFCHFTVTGQDDAGVTQTQGGWIVVGNAAATFPLAGQSGDGQSGAKGTQLPNPLTVTLNAGQSGGSATGASVFFTTDGGTLSNGTTSGSKVIAITNGSGVASVTLTLPNVSGQVHVTAEAPYGLGHPTATFTETAH